MATQGTFLDVVGLTYRCGSVEGTTSKDFEFSYEPGQLVTFSIGSLVLGESIGKPLMTVSSLLLEGTPIADAKLLNRARLLYSLAPGQGLEQPIVIDEKVRTSSRRLTKTRYQRTKLIARGRDR